MKSSANDNASPFQDFMVGYWHRMSPELYSELNEALADFKAVEGEQRHQQLLADLCRLAGENRFPTIVNIQAAYNDPFWSSYDRILTIDEFNACDPLAQSHDCGGQ